MRWLAVAEWFGAIIPGIGRQGKGGRPLTLKKHGACGIVILMGTGKAYPEQRDIRAIAILLATQGMIRLGEIPDPLSGRAVLDTEGARFFIDLLRALQEKTENNLSPAEAAFLGDAVDNLRQILAKKTEAKNG